MAIWIGLAVAILAIWLAATVMSIAPPEMVTGTDPTRIPIAALVSPADGDLRGPWPGAPDRAG